MAEISTGQEVRLSDAAGPALRDNLPVTEPLT